MKGIKRNFITNNMILKDTVYTIYMTTIKLDELESNANWLINSFTNRATLSIDSFTNTHNTCDHNYCWRTLNLVNEAKIVKLPN